MKKAFAWFLVVVMILSGSIAAWATPEVAYDSCCDDDEMNCMLVAIGKDVSPTGYPIVGHNEDDGGRVMMRHGYVAPATWPAGSVLPAEQGRAAIPQVETTYGFFWSQAKAAGGGFSNADGFLNENGVFLVSNSNASSKTNNDSSRLTDGGIEYNLRRVVAERATSARHAAQIIIDMVEDWGYAPSGRAYTVADKNEIWMVQIVTGRYYVAVRVPDDHVAIMPNHYTVHGLDEYDEILYPEDIVEYAIGKGWYTPAVEGDYSDFDFAYVFQASGSYKASGNTYRHKHALRLLLGEWEEDSYPFSVKVDDVVSFDTVKDILSTHYEGTADDPDNLRVGPGNAPHDTTLRRICTGTTIESVICQFTEDVEFTTLWTAFGRPCELPYIPLHPLTGELPVEIQQMEDPAYDLENHLQPGPEMMVYENTGWQEFRDFQGLLEMVYDQHVDAVSELIDDYISEMYAANLQLITDGDETALSVFDQSATTSALHMLQDYADEFIKPVELQGSYINRLEPGEAYDVTFSMADGETPVESSLLFGMNFLNTRTQYLSAIVGSLTNLGDNLWKASFNAASLASRAACAGEFEHILGGLTTDNKTFTGLLKINFTDGVPDVVSLTTEAHNVKQGEYVTLNAAFLEETESNVAVLAYTFDGDKFEYAGFTPAAGVTLVNEEFDKGFAEITLAIMDYKMQNLGDIMLRAKEDAELVREHQNVNLEVEFVLRDGTAKTIETAAASASFTTVPEDDYTLIDLSNIIDWFGIDSNHPDWTTVYTFWDFNDDGEIGIYDISYVAKLIK